MKKDIINMVKVKKGVPTIIQTYVSEYKFYRVDENQQIMILNLMGQQLTKLYDINKAAPIVEKDDSLRYGAYNPETKKILIGKPSMITYLNAFRAFMMEEGLGEPEIEVDYLDRMAWSARAFQLACPKSFEKSVRNGNVVGFEWDESQNRAVANC